MSTTQRVRLYDFEVRGRGPFPMDMLRYDCCWPVRGEDVSAIDDNAERRDHRAVRLIRCAQNGAGPTIGRWESFGWVVMSIDGEPAYSVRSCTTATWWDACWCGTRAPNSRAPVTHTTRWWRWLTGASRTIGIPCATTEPAAPFQPPIPNPFQGANVLLKHTETKPGFQPIVTEVEITEVQEFPEHKLIIGRELKRFVYREGHRELGRFLPPSRDFTGRWGYCLDNGWVLLHASDHIRDATGQVHTPT